MLKILLSADWHILLHKKKVPSDWQANRFRLFFDKLHELEQECDIHIIAGDIFDKEPRVDEVTLFQRFANSVNIRTIIIPGNHEATRKGKTFFTHFLEKNAITNPNIEIYTENTLIEHEGVKFQLFPYGEMQLDNLPIYEQDSILVTHIRGEVPPHVSPEYDFEKLRPWKLILLGDLHFAHQYKDYPAFYPGSPINVTFDRHNKKEYGVNIIDFNSVNDYNVKFVPLKLPKLLRKIVSVEDSKTLEKDDFHHIIYEVQGSLDEISSVEKTDIVDKVIAQKPSEAAAIDFTNLDSIEKELRAYLQHINIENIDKIMNTYAELNI